MKPKHSAALLEDTANFMNFFAISAYTPNKNTSAYFKWKIVNNPYLEGYIHLEKENSEVISSLTVTPKRISSFGQVVDAAELGEALTHPDFRRRGLFDKSAKKCTEYALRNKMDIIYGTPNRFSLAGMRKLDYLPYPFAEISNLRKHPIGVKQLLLLFKQQPEGRRQALVNLLKSYLAQLTTRKHFRIHWNDHVKIERSKEFKGDFDGLWKKDRSDYGFFTLRDANYLNWRFIENPDEYQIFTANDNGSLAGYIVAKVSTNDGFKIGTICDFISKDDEPEIFYRLLKHVEKYFKKIGVRHIRVWCSNNSSYFEELKNSGYTVSGNRPVIVCSDTEKGKKVLATDSKWHFTVADCDHI